MGVRISPIFRSIIEKSASLVLCSLFYELILIAISKIIFMLLFNRYVGTLRVSSDSFTNHHP